MTLTPEQIEAGMTLDEAMKVWADASDAYLSDGVGPNCAAAATVIQQAFAERVGEIERLRAALEPFAQALFDPFGIGKPSFTREQFQAARRALAAKGDSRG